MNPATSFVAAGDHPFERLSFMANQVLAAMALTDRAGQCSSYSQAMAQALCLKAPLIGSLTLSGFAAADGSPLPWVVAPGSSGYVAPPANARHGVVWFDFAVADDAGKALFVTRPI